MARLILGVTGSVAAIKAPALFAALQATGHDVRVVATRPALYFFDPEEIEPPQTGAGPAGADRRLFRDDDEWPGAGYRRSDPVLHIEFRRWADVLIVAPLDANTLAKFAAGLSDNFLTCVYRAWDFTKPVLLAPAMNTLMWESPVTRRHLRQLLEDRATSPIPTDWTLDQVSGVFAHSAPRIVLIPPQAKRLACGDVGVGAMAEVSEIAELVRQWSDQAGPGEAPSG